MVIQGRYITRETIEKSTAVIEELVEDSWSEDDSISVKDLDWISDIQDESTEVD
ncbi:MAG: hypothetical protein ACOCR6_00545 [archaeon]